jgi:DNA-binding GntR family transcriptional regulator
MEQAQSGRPGMVYDRLRQDILEGALGFGARLKIDDIARRYGVSHMPVREALQRLQGEHLVVNVPNRGASVRAIDLKFVEDNYDIIMQIESLLARRAAERGGARLASSLEAAQRRMEDAAQAGDVAAAAVANGAFHDVINVAADNAQASEIAQRHLDLVNAFWRALGGYDPQRLPGVLADHRSLIRAIVDGNADVAAAIGLAHAAKARIDLIARMREAMPASRAKREQAS